MTDKTGTQNNSEDSPTSAGSLLASINNASDLRLLPESQLPQLCDEIRSFLIENLAVNPGHFASSMGAVEIIVAIHYVFDTPTDRIVFDVGHQAYAHKLLTGRREAFKTQRKLGGISGFPSPMESECDSFVAGHAGNSISAALGMAIADSLTEGNEKRHTVALIGDASISGGLAFEGLNNASNNPNNLLIILNDNEMSIDNNVGALHHYLSKVNTSAGYNRWRNNTYNFFKKLGLISEKEKGRFIRFNNSLKALISAQQNIFEGLNIRYFGPFDGHDIHGIIRVLREIKDMTGPRLLHLHTVKGKGYSPAEKEPAVWHAPGKFNPQTGEKIKGTQSEKWQDVFGRKLIELAEKHDDIVGITAAMPSGTSMSGMMARFPRRTFDVGISEGHAVTFAGGLAAAGKHPFVAIYSSFLQRSYDNIINDVAIQGLPVTFCIDRAGIVGEDGVTHHGLFDLAYLRCVPGLEIYVPSDKSSLRTMMDIAYNTARPVAIRYPRGGIPVSSEFECRNLAKGKGRGIICGSNARIAVLSLGPVMYDALEAIRMVESEGIAVDLYDMLWLKPLDTTLLDDIRDKYDVLLTLEDGTVSGGFGTAVAQHYASASGHPEVLLCGVDDMFVEHGTIKELKHLCGYDAERLAEKLRELDNSLSLR